MDLSTRSYQKELLDRGDIPFVDIKRNMRELEFINTYLGGHAITIEGVKTLLRKFPMNARESIVICEIGCGGGDNLKAIGSWCMKKKIDVSFIGIDINADCINIAERNCGDLAAEFIHSDYKKVSFEDSPAIIFSSLFCHHFSNDELVFMLQWMSRHSKLGFFINDLHRHSLAYYSIKWLSRLFSSSYLVKNDAPLSVARGFKREEWISLFQSAKLQYFEIKWKWAFRWLLIAVNRPDVPSLHIK